MPDLNRVTNGKRSRNEAFGNEEEELERQRDLARLYKDTDVSKGGLRLLKLQGGSKELRANLVLREKEPLENGAEAAYMALSYTWGSGVKEANLEIVSGGNILPLAITGNLAAALRQLRYENNPKNFRLLWIDAVCINQDDIEERNAQVKRMGQIFGEAERVIVWLGEEKDGSSKALTFIQRILDLEHVSSLAQDITCVDDWAALFQLLRRDWFGRRWVIQEIALAKPGQAFVHCGKSSIPWQKFAFAVSLFASKHTELRELFKRSEKYNYNLEYLGNVNELGAVHLIHISNNLFRRSKATMDFLLSLETLVSMLPTFEASRAQDTIFAVLSLAADVGKSGSTEKMDDVENKASVPRLSEEVELPDLTDAEKNKASLVINKFRQRKDDTFYRVDYDQSFFDVCKYFLDWTTKKSKTLDIICRPWATTKTSEDLPSWIPTLAGLAFKPDRKGISRRVRADPLVGMPGSKRNYNASRAYRGNWSFGTDFDEKVLSVEGFVLDVIGVKKLPAQSGNIPFEWLVAGDWGNTQELPPDPFWRTLVADRGPDQENPPPYYSLACQHAYAMGVDGDDLKTEPFEGCPDIVTEFLGRARSVVWQRCLIITKENQMLGLVPYDSNQDDLICILHGCSVPVILRPYRDDVIGKTYHRFIGECYIHSMMDGGASRIRDEKKERINASKKEGEAKIESLIEVFYLR